ncbi:palmitoyltransferase [Thraustotheca clavata]|uniref:Palmitoyltransferase n=1 Tax=Thraustotheca clavata TaxID=74557 RepID=A0A1W0A4U4_9STRA|nr:palmitoyltransferase [Thraustotheca clavata]
MWFVKDGGVAVAGLGISLMLGGVSMSLCNLYMWKGATLSFYVGGGILMILSILAASAHWHTMTTDPGTVPKDVIVLSVNSEQENDEWSYLNEEIGILYCELCDANRPKCATHCDSCNNCIVMMDHHCPWVNNCVGIGTLKNFILLLVYLPTTCIFMGALTIWQVTSCPKDCGFQQEMQPGKSGVAIMAIGFIFGVLCFIMIILEMFSIHYDERLAWIVHKIHDRRLKDITMHHRFGVIFGSDRFQWHWLIPSHNVHQSRSNADLEIIMGYCLPHKSSSQE